MMLQLVYNKWLNFKFTLLLPPKEANPQDPSWRYRPIDSTLISIAGKQKEWSRIY
jgi:hypothetical protein